MTAPMPPEPCDTADPTPATVPPLGWLDLAGQLTVDELAHMDRIADLHLPEEHL